VTDAGRIKRVSDDLDAFVEKAVRQLQLRVFQVLTSASPVQTGFFRAGWTPSTGQADRSGLSSRPANLEAAASFAASRFSQNNQKAAQIAATYRLSAGTVFIVNNVRYGIALNAGSSAQAPAMFVETAIAQAVQATNAALGQNVFRTGF